MAWKSWSKLACLVMGAHGFKTYIARPLIHFRICTLPELKAKIPEFERVLHDPIQFKELYRYAFGYVKSKDQKCMEVDVRKLLFSLSGMFFWPLMTAFTQFTDSHCHVEAAIRQSISSH
jgi:hypothetical protein